MLIFFFLIFQNYLNNLLVLMQGLILSYFSKTKKNKYTIDIDIYILILFLNFYSRPWMIYWITHGLALLGNDAQVFHERIIDTLSHFQNPSGGFGGGPNQLTHGAPNFASILTLCEIGTNESLGMIDRVAMYNHLLSIRSPGGGFTMHMYVYLFISLFIFPS